jgi:hypothetical protein
MDTLKIMDKAFGEGEEFGNLKEELHQTLIGTSLIKRYCFIFNKVIMVFLKLTITIRRF